MSDAAEPEHDADAWAAACEEDLAAEQARRREEYGPQPVSAADELRKLADALTARVAEFGKPLGGPAGQFAAQGMAQQLIAQARAVVEPVVDRNPQVFDHLATAGNELLAAYRAAVERSEEHWSAELRPQDARDVRDVPDAIDAQDPPEPTDDGTAGPGPAGRD